MPKNDRIACCLCGRSKGEKERFFHGENSYVCTGCIDLCYALLVGTEQGKSEYWEMPSKEILCLRSSITVGQILEKFFYNKQATVSEFILLSNRYLKELERDLEIKSLAEKLSDLQNERNKKTKEHLEEISGLDAQMLEITELINKAREEK